MNKIPKDGTLPVGELRAAIMTAIEDVFVHTLEVKLDEDVPMLTDTILALFTAATNEKLAGGGDEELDTELRRLWNSAQVLGYQLGTSQADNKLLESFKLINTAKQTAVAEERARLIGLLPEKFDGTVYGSEYESGRNLAIAEMRNILEGK